MEQQLGEEEIKMKSLEIFLFSNWEPGILGLNYETKIVTKKDQKIKIANTPKNTKLGNYKYPGKSTIFSSKKKIDEVPNLETSMDRRSSIISMWKLTSPTPPVLKPVNVLMQYIPPMHFFTPNKEVLQMLIRKAWVSKLQNLEVEYINAFQSGEKLVNLIE